MTGLEYMRTVCPTTRVGKDPNKEDVVDAFEDGIAEGYRQAMEKMKENELNRQTHKNNRNQSQDERLY